MAKVIMIFVLMFTATIYGEIISDPMFKNPDTNWKLRKGKEYKQVKELYKKGEFSMVSPAASARTYLVLFTEAQLEEGEVYKFQVEVKTPGSGLVGYAYGTYGDIFAEDKKIKGGKRARSKDEKGQNLGLMVETEDLSSEWKIHTCHFKVKPKKSEMNTYMKIMLGEYQGEFKLRNPSLVKAENAPSVKGKGVLEVN